MARPSTWTEITERLDGVPGIVARLARDPVARCAALTTDIRSPEAEIAALTADLAPLLLEIVGCGPLERCDDPRRDRPGVDRFRSPDAYARHNGTAPLPVWSSNRTRQRL